MGEKECRAVDNEATVRISSTSGDPEGTFSMDENNVAWTIRILYIPDPT